jgi:hypothetical protein
MGNASFRRGPELGRSAARSPGGDGSPALPQPREETEEARLDVAEPPVASPCTGRRRPRRMALAAPRPAAEHGRHGAQARKAACRLGLGHAWEARYGATK